jgi:hypothetical protein
MTEEIINQTPQQTEFTVQLPDRELQWEKCPAYVKKTKQVIQSTTEIVDGIEVTKASDPINVEYTELAMEDTGAVGEHGELIKNVIKLSDVAAKVSAAVVEIGKGGAIKVGEVLELSPSEVKQASLHEALITSFADEEGVVDEQALKEKASWGLGCPANCGGFREFSYVEMVPQNYKCAVCGVTIILV